MKQTKQMKQNRQQLKNDRECQAYDAAVFEIFYNETQALKRCSIEQPTDGKSRYDALLNGKHYVELKQRNCTAFQYNTYFANKDKIDHLNSIATDGQRVFFVCLFADKWFTLDVTNKTFPHEMKYVYNPKFGRPL